MLFLVDFSPGYYQDSCGGHAKRDDFFSAALALASLSLLLSPQLLTADSADALQLQAGLLTEMDNAA